MKLGIVVHCPSPHQKVLLDHLCRVADADVVVAYAYPRSPNRNWGVPLAEGRTMMVPGGRRFEASRSLRDWVSQLGRDVWVVGSAYTFSRTHALAAAIDSLRLPWAYLGEPPRPRTGLRALARDWMLHRVLRRCHGVIATGVESARRYRALLGNDRPVTSVPYHIPLDEWLMLPAATAPGPGEPVRFLAMSQLIERKGIDVLIAACDLLPRGGWSLDIHGEGRDRPSLQRMIDARALPVSLNPPLAFADRMRAFRGRHYFVFPSRWDGWGMALVEALAAGLPVIASEMAMSAHDFVTAENGWVVPCTPGGIAGAMKAAIDDAASLARRSLAARAAVADFRPAAGAEEMVRFCRELASRARAGSGSRAPSSLPARSGGGREPTS